MTDNVLKILIDAYLVTNIRNEARRIKDMLAFYCGDNKRHYERIRQRLWALVDNGTLEFTIDREFRLKGDTNEITSIK